MNDRNEGALAPYLRMLRDHRVLIVVVTLLFAGATAAFSFTRPSEYQSVAQLSFQEESQSNAVAGIAAVQVSTATELAAKGVAAVTSEAVLREVKADLNTPLSTDDLRSRLTATVDTSSNLVDVTATAKDERFAAALANAVAERTVAGQVTSERARFRRIAAQIQRELNRRLAGVKRNDVAGALAASSGYSDRLASLNTLAVSASPAKIATTATVPDSPSSPKPIRDTIIGAFVGLLAGLVLAFVRDALDRRLRDAADVREHLELPVVGTVRRAALGRLPFIGTDDAKVENHDTEAFRSLRTNVELLRGQERPGTIVVTSALPEEGKSTVSASLALASATAGRLTVLVECDLRRPCLSERFGLRPSPGLVDYLAGTAEPFDVIRSVELPPSSLSATPGAPPQLVVVPAGEPTSNPAELLGSPRFAEFLSEIAETYDTVVVDTAPVLSVADTLEIVPSADAVLFCVRADQTTRSQATAAKAALQRIPDKQVAVVITGVSPNRDEDYGYYSSTYVTAGD